MYSNTLKNSENDLSECHAHEVQCGHYNFIDLWFHLVPDYWGIAAPGRRSAAAIVLWALFFVASATPAQELKLPKLGESSTSMFSAEFEHQLGRTWLRIFRSQVPTVNDPLLYDYLENLIYMLATHSQLEDRRIEIVVVDNPTINAFAVPGGVIGIHNGLLLWAQTQDELATVRAALTDGDGDGSRVGQAGLIAHGERHGEGPLIDIGVLSHLTAIDGGAVAEVPVVEEAAPVGVA